MAGDLLGVVGGYGGGEVQTGGVDGGFVGATYKWWMIHTGQIDDLMAFKRQGRMVSVPVCPGRTAKEWCVCVCGTDRKSVV